MKMIVSPEGLELANTYLECGGSIDAAAKKLNISKDKAVQILNKSEVKRYIDSVYMDLGYRNRFKLASLLDEVIESKLAEAKETEMYTTKDLVDLIHFAHKMRMDELKIEHSNTTIRNQTNVQINETPFGQGNYGKLMEKLLNVKDIPNEA